MTAADLEKRAELTVWSRRSPSHAAQGRPFATLREALVVAAQVIESEDARPWIITEAGDILSPHWIRTNARARSVQ
jgi:hypothetical protein